MGRIKEKLKEILIKPSFNGNLNIEINFKDNGYSGNGPGITHMNMGEKESFRMP